MRIKLLYLLIDWDMKHINRCMTGTYDRLVSRDVSTHRDQKQKLRTFQLKEMEPRQVNRESNAFYSSVAASNDQYMKDITYTNN